MKKSIKNLSKKFWLLYLTFTICLTTCLYKLTTEQISISLKSEEKLSSLNIITPPKNDNVEPIEAQEEIQNILGSHKNLLAEAITYNQFPNYETGCESIALYILLKYYDVDITPEDIINNLRIGDVPYYENGYKYGGNPEIEFIGNPRYSYGYGTYNESLAEVATKYKEGIISRKDFDFSYVYELINENRPVLVWTTIGMSEPFISDSWIYKLTGEVINWISGEHAVVVIGYDNYNIIVSDPYTGTVSYYDKYLFIERYNYLGKRALYY